MRKFQSHTEKGIAALIFMTAVFALLSVLARYLDSGFTILQQVYLRVFVALILAVIVFHRYIRWEKIAALPLREWLVIAFRGFVMYAVGVTLISQSTTMTTIGNVSFIAALPFVPLLGFLFLKEKVTPWKLAFIGASVFGVALLAVRDFGNLLSWNAGDIVAIIATLGFAISYVTRKWHADILNNQELTALTLVFGAGFVFMFSMFLGEGAPPLDGSWTLWLAILLGGIFNVANVFLVNYGFQHVDAVRGGNLLTLESAWGVLFGFLFYSEFPTWLGLLGGVIIVGSVIGMNTYSHRQATKQIS